MQLKVKSFVLFVLLVSCWLPAHARAQEHGVAAVSDIQNILPVQEQERLMDGWLQWRLDHILPELMRREGIDMWLVINREFNEDPVYLTLVPRATINARRNSILIFHDRGQDEGIERLTGSYYGMGDWYEPTWTDKGKTQFESLAEVIKSRNPRRIGIDVSSDWAFGDGLSASLRDKLEQALGPDYSSRLVSADRICVGWLETRSPQELSVYRHIGGIAHDMIAEFYSNKIITPDVTTTDDVVWWIRQKARDLGFEMPFQPDIFIARKKEDPENMQGFYLHDYTAGDLVIRRGDLLHCDFGIEYLGLNTDMQWEAYVLRHGETDAPQGIKDAMARANRVADILMGEFEEGRSGNEIARAAHEKAEAEGLRPTLYTHPLGIDVHGAGPPMESRAEGIAPEGFEIRGEYPLYPNTAYAIEFQSLYSLPEWGGQDIRLGFEEDAVFTNEGIRFIDGYQKKLYLIR